MEMTGQRSESGRRWREQLEQLEEHGSGHGGGMETSLETERWDQLRWQSCYCTPYLPAYLPSRASTETRYLDSSGSINSFSSQVSIELRKCGDVEPAAVLPTKCVRKPDGQQGV